MHHKKENERSDTAPFTTTYILYYINCYNRLKHPILCLILSSIDAYQFVSSFMSMIPSAEMLLLKSKHEAFFKLQKNNNF